LKMMGGGCYVRFMVSMQGVLVVEVNLTRGKTGSYLDSLVEYEFLLANMKNAVLMILCLVIK